MKIEPVWLSAPKLLQHWNAEDEWLLLDVVKKGLQAYDKSNGVNCPIESLDKISRAIEKFRNPDGFSYTGELTFHNIFFKYEEVRQFEADHREIFSDPTFDDNKQAEYMRLKKANKRLALIAEATPYMAYFVAGRFEKDGTRTTKKEFCAEGLKNFPNLSRNYFEVTLWKTVPKRYKHLNNTDNSDS